MSSDFLQPVDSLAELRRVALYLHGIKEEDRAWLLSKLPTSFQDKLRNLVDEINALGLPENSFHLLPAIPQKATAKSHKKSLSLSGVEYLNQLDAEFVLALFHKEPMDFLAVFLNSYSWRWKQSVVEIYDPSKRLLLQEKLLNAEQKGEDFRIDLTSTLGQALVLVIENKAKEMTLKLDSNKIKISEIKETLFFKIKRFFSF